MLQMRLALRDVGPVSGSPAPPRYRNTERPQRSRLPQPTDRRCEPL